MRGVLLAAMLAAGSPTMLHRPPTAPTLGRLVKVVATADGRVAVYRDALGCFLTFRGVVADRVDLRTCQS